MTALRTAAQQALEALEAMNPYPASKEDQRANALAALRAALAQQEEPVEPVAWSGYDLDGMVEALSRVVEAHYQRANPFQNPIDMDAQMALRALRGFIPAMKAYTALPQRKQAEPAQEPITRLFGTLPVHDTQQALAQQAEPDHEARAELAEQQVVQLAEERDHYRNLWQKAQQAEPAQAQRCRAEPRSDGDYACDCKIGACPGRSAEPVAWTDRERRVVRFALKCFISQALDRHAAAAQDVRGMWFKPGDHLKFYQDAEDATSALTKMGAAEPLGVPGGGHLAAPPADNHSPQG